MIKLLSTWLVLTTMVGLPSAQQRPDFSGTWNLDEARSGSPGWVEFVGPVVRVIRIAPQTLEIDITGGKKTTSLRYPLTATRTVPTKDAAPANQAYWNGDRLVTETMQVVSGQTVTMREEITMAADGQELVVERVVEVEHGYEIRGGKNNSMVRDVFVRAR